MFLFFRLMKKHCIQGCSTYNMIRKCVCNSSVYSPQRLYRIYNYVSVVAPIKADCGDVIFLYFQLMKKHCIQGSTYNMIRKCVCNISVYSPQRLYEDI